MTTDVEEDFVLTPVDPIAELRAEVTKLDTELRQELARETERADRAERDLSALRDRHRGDIALIGSVLMEEANDREWCDEYDRVIERLNDRLSVQLPVREKNHQVEISVTYRYDVQVLATDQEEAEDIIGGLSMAQHWSPGLPFSDDRVELDSSYAYGVEVEVV